MKAYFCLVIHKFLQKHSKMKYYIIAGERSGDLHASNLMKAIQQDDSQAEFRFWGGDEMQKVGGTMVKHYREMAFMGFLEVVQNLRTILGFIKECKKDIQQYQPNAVILVDYAGFNMRIAKFIKKENLPIKVFFYISPKVWAWNTKRAYKVKANVDRLFVIFPFEVNFYKKFEYEVDYVGNPLLDAKKNFAPNPQFLQTHHLEGKRIIALLPGSRKQEVTKLLAEMLTIRSAFPAHQFVIAGVSNLPKEYYEAYQQMSHVQVIFDETYDLLSHAEAAVVTSGTATLETALFEVPQVVVYKMSPVTYSIAIRVVKVDHFSLVNLVAEKEIVTELLQKEVNTRRLITELRAIIQGGKKRMAVMKGYQEIKEKLGNPGASEKTGRLIVKYLKKEKIK